MKRITYNIKGRKNSSKELLFVILSETRKHNRGVPSKELDHDVAKAMTMLRKENSKDRKI